MKIITTFFVLFIYSVAHCQNWQQVTSNTTDEIMDMYFKDETTGFAVTGLGKILRTIDSGDNWNIIYENNNLYQEQSIVVTNDSVFCFASDIDGNIKKLSFTVGLEGYTISTFQSSFVPQDPLFYNNTIFDSGVKYENNQFIPLTGDVTPSGSSISNGSSQMYNNDNNLTASDGHFIFHSQDGDIWNTIQFAQPFLSSGPYQSYYDGSGKMRTVTNYPCVVHISNDNGLNWSYNLVNVQSLYFCFLNFEKVLALNLFTEENKIYYSKNSGITFEFETVSNPVKSLYNYNNVLQFAYGSNGVIYKSVNGGGILTVNDLKKKESDIVIYPNPLQDVVSITYDETDMKIRKVAINDMSGRTLKTVRSNFSEINLQNLVSGSYLLIFYTDKGNVAKKVLKK